MQRAAIGLALVGALGLGVMRLGAQDVPDKKLESILKDTRIWGKHFAEVLAAMPAWSETGEEKIVVFQQRVEGSREFRSATEARKADTETRAARKKRWVPTPAFADLLNPVMNRPLVRTPASPKATRDGESVHLAWANQRELLAPNLTKAQLIEALGQPESVVRRLQPTEDERRPVALTEFRYANTTAVFAQPDYAPKPGIIDRAVLKCTPVVNTVFRP
jgi:hypothetical protein